MECFFVISGQQEVLTHIDGKFTWTMCWPGDYIEVPSGAKHAFRNLSSTPSTSLIITTEKLGRFFENVGRPVINGEIAPPTPEILRNFIESAISSGYWLGSSEENVSVGLSGF